MGHGPREPIWAFALFTIGSESVVTQIALTAVHASAFSFVDKEPPTSITLCLHSETSVLSEQGFDAVGVGSQIGESKC